MVMSLFVIRRQIKVYLHRLSENSKKKNNIETHVSTILGVFQTYFNAPIFRSNVIFNYRYYYGQLVY